MLLVQSTVILVKGSRGYEEEKEETEKENDKKLEQEVTDCLQRSSPSASLEPFSKITCLCPQHSPLDSILSHLGPDHILSFFLCKNHQHFPPIYA